jgi:hypothetical protein
MTSEYGQTIGLGSLLWDHFFARFSAPQVDLTGRTVLVTEDNAG